MRTSKDYARLTSVLAERAAKLSDGIAPNPVGDWRQVKEYYIASIVRNADNANAHSEYALDPLCVKQFGESWILDNREYARRNYLSARRTLRILEDKYIYP